MFEICDGWDVANLVMHGAFDELGEASKAAHVGAVQVQVLDPAQCFFVGGEVEQRRASARRHLVKSVALFQAGMESLINHWGTKYPKISSGGSFVKKWEHAFTVKEQVFDFNDYATLYRKIRNAIIHPNTAERIATINTLGFLPVHRGIRCGWDAFGKLAASLGEPHDKDSWDIMCNAHGVPIDPSEGGFPDLTALRAELHKRYLDELNAKRVTPPA